MLSPSEQALYFRSLSGSGRVLDKERVKRILAVSDAYAVKLLHKLAKRGAAIKVVKGVYVLATAEAVGQKGPPVIDPWAVLDEVMKRVQPEYFVAYVSAAYLHGAVTEIPFNITVAAPRQRRPFRLGSSRVIFHVVRKEKWFGTQRVRQSGEFVTVSDPERTLLDCASRPDLCGGADGLAEVALELAWKVKPGIVREYLRRSDDEGIAHRLGFIVSRLARHRAPRQVAPLIRVLSKGVGEGVHSLDPGRNRRGARMDPRWRVWVNADVEAWRRA